MKGKTYLIFGIILPLLLSFGTSLQKAHAQETELIYACENCGFEYLLPLENGYKIALFKRQISNAQLAVLDQQNLITDSLRGETGVGYIYKIGPNSIGSFAGIIGELMVKNGKIYINKLIAPKGELWKQKELGGYGFYFYFPDYFIVKSFNPRKGKEGKIRKTRVGYFKWEDLPQNWEHDVVTRHPTFFDGRLPDSAFVNLQYHKNPEAIKMYKTKITWVTNFEPYSEYFNAKNRIAYNANTSTAYFINGHRNGEITYFAKQTDGTLNSGVLKHTIDTKTIQFHNILVDFFTGTLYAVVRNSKENNRRELWEINVNTGNGKPVVVLRDIDPYHIEARRLYYVQKKDGLTAAYRVSF